MTSSLKTLAGSRGLAHFSKKVSEIILMQRRHFGFASCEFCWFGNVFFRRRHWAHNWWRKSISCLRPEESLPGSPDMSSESIWAPQTLASPWWRVRPPRSLRTPRAPEPHRLSWHLLQVIKSIGKIASFTNLFNDVEIIFRHLKENLIFTCGIFVWAKLILIQQFSNITFNY